MGGATRSWGMVAVVMALMLMPSLEVAGACPQSCACWETMYGTRAECRGGYLHSIFSGAGPEMRDIHIVTPDPHHELMAKDFDSLALVPLKNLSLHHSSVQVVKDDAFKSLRVLERLDLSYNALYRLEPGAFRGLDHLRDLSLAHNRLSSLGTVLQSLHGLEQLDLSYNALSDLMTGSFKSQVRLWRLKLDGNRLQSLHGYVFQGLQNLQVLSLRNCNLLHISANMFSVIRSLSKLDLGQNHISHPPRSQEFRNLPSLRELYMDSNEITNLYDAQFSGITLDTLDLSRNRITQINRNTFSFFNVRHLDLSYNMIYTVAESFLRPTAPQLEELDLANNPLREIPRSAFEGLYRLESLNLSACSLEELEAELFRDVRTLRFLDLSMNHLQNLPATMLEDFNQLDVLSVTRNFWHCDCHIKPLHEWLQEESAHRVMGCPHGDCQHAQLLCTTPSRLLNAEIVRLADTVVTDCQAEPTSSHLPGGTQAAIVVACLTFALILLIVTACLWKRGKTHQGLKAACIREHDSGDAEDEVRKVRPFQDIDSRSLNESDKSYVFKKYFRTMVPNAGLGLTSGGSAAYMPTSQRDVDSMYSSQPSLYSTTSLTVGIESTV